MEQNFKNHIRYYAPHHFIFYPVMLLVMGFCVGRSLDNENRLIWIFLFLAFLSVTLLSFMLRQHYALTLQDRIVLQELRYRYFATTGQRLEPYEDKLSKGQLFALRFAPDEEMPALLEKAIAENLDPKAIKQSIKHWKPDNQRV
ncbi:hypothetical protein GN157_06895 [Flavobacterium rakeshii]|uniref:Uncharacterized protein n=1 Tax=Flavobacterium rakeshii TaxID=1038845 RepID=A0A6N8HAG0_9FLAO|nr:DUF6526 family protein [Flavobacterium rakeshii]MUV03431.1 hypothetical protein [Flavobacterium rakeshii]